MGVPFGVPAKKGGDGPAPIDPKGEDPFGNGGSEGEKGEDGANGEKGEKNGSGGNPTREEFMNPSFGGFYKDDDDVSALEGPDGLKR